MATRTIVTSRPDVACRSAGIRSAWGSGEISYRDGFREPLGAGWIIDRSRFEQLLSARAVDAGTEWFWGSRLRAFEPCDAGWRLDTDALAEIERILRTAITDPVGPEFMAPPARAEGLRSGNLTSSQP